MKTADFLVERLKSWGVKRIFGYSGDGINGVIGAIQRDGEIDFIQPRHEEMGAFMAVGYAKFSGELGVCLATGGPGATHLITGLYDARADHTPLLAICGQAGKSSFEVKLGSNEAAGSVGSRPVPGVLVRSLSARLPPDSGVVTVKTPAWLGSCAT